MIKCFQKKKFFLIRTIGVEMVSVSGLQMQIVVNNPPDLFSHEGSSGIRRMVEAFEVHFF